MVIALTLKIASLLLILSCGFVLVKSKVLKSEDSHILSVMSLYLFSPCAIIYSTQVNITSEVIEGLILALIAATVVQLLMIVIATVLAKILHGTVVEKLSVIYTNSGNLIIPLVTATLGPEYVIYAVPFMATQNFLLWSHAKSSLEESKSIDIMKILKNVNMIAIFACIPILIFGFKFPTVVGDAMLTFSNFLGPACMLTSGMLIASLPLKTGFLNGRVWVTTLLRLVVVPLILVIAMKLLVPYIPVANAASVLTLTVMATAAPSASAIVQMSQVYGKDPHGAQNASAINTATLLSCIVTMPLMLMLFQL